MIHQIVADRVVPASLDGDLDLRSDAVGAGDEHRTFGLGWHAEHAAESTEATTRARREGGLDEALDARLGIVRGVDVDAGATVIERAAAVGHASISCSNATRRWNSRTRAATSAGPSSSKRSIENFSTAKDPIAEP